MQQSTLAKTNFICFVLIQTFACLLTTTVSYPVYSYENYNLESIESDNWIPDAVTDPVIGSRCLSLSQKRNNKLKLKKKITELISKNNEILKRVPQRKTSIQETLKNSHKRLQEELQIITLGIEAVTEDLLLKGCPAVSF